MSESSTPNWWGAEAWWLDATYTTGCRCSSAEIANAVAVMRQHFDEPWWDSVLQENKLPAVITHLAGKGLGPLAFIVGLGRDLRSLHDAQHLDRKLDALKRDETESTILEVEIAAIYARAGWVVSFPKESDKRSPDIFVERGDERAAIECKRLQREKWEEWVSDLMTTLMHQLPWSHQGRAIVIQVQLDSRISEMRWPDKEYASLNIAFLVAISKRVCGTVREALTSEDLKLPKTLVIGGVATIRIMPESPGISSAVTGGEISQTAQLRRILQNGVVRAIGQIPQNVPGIVVVQTEYVPQRPLGEVALEALSKAGPPEFHRVAAVLVKPVQYWTWRRDPLLLLNPAYPGAAALSAIRVLNVAV